MAALSIRDLDDAVKERLRLRAAQNGRSMEAEIRVILTSAVADETPGNDLFTALIERFAQLGGADLELPPRATPPRAAALPE
jgi:plasmid stability protein